MDFIVSNYRHSTLVAATVVVFSFFGISCSTTKPVSEGERNLAAVQTKNMHFKEMVNYLVDEVQLARKTGKPMPPPILNIELNQLSEATSILAAACPEYKLSFSNDVFRFTSEKNLACSARIRPPSDDPTWQLGLKVIGDDIVLAFSGANGMGAMFFDSTDGAFKRGWINGDCPGEHSMATLRCPK